MKNSKHWIHTVVGIFIIALLSSTQMGGCGGGGGGSDGGGTGTTSTGGTSTGIGTGGTGLQVKESSTDGWGKSSFTDSSTGESVEITVVSADAGTAIPNVEVTFFDGPASDGFEVFYVSDPSGVYWEGMVAYAHNSAHTITMKLKSSNYSFDETIDPEQIGAFEKFWKYAQNATSITMTYEKSISHPKFLIEKGVKFIAIELFTAPIRSIKALKFAQDVSTVGEALDFAGTAILNPPYQWDRYVLEWATSRRDWLGNPVRVKEYVYFPSQPPSVAIKELNVTGGDASARWEGSDSTNYNSSLTGTLPDLTVLNGATSGNDIEYTRKVTTQDGTVVYDWSVYSKGTTITMSSLNTGVYTLYVQAIDEVGNLSTTASANFTVSGTGGGGSGAGSAPTVSTSPAGNVSTNSATLSGYVNPNRLTTTVWFEWGTSTTYGNSTTVQTFSGTTSQFVSSAPALTGLQSNTTYHFRIVASNSIGVSNGNDQTFITSSGSTPGTIIASSRIACGDHHTLALKDDGTVWAWGSNFWNQIGDGTMTDRNAPVQVTGLSGVIAVDGGNEYSFALKSDSTVWSWGAGGYGQIGDGTNTGSSTPVQVSGLSGVTQVSGGAYFAGARRNDGTIWMWGYNNTGQLGNGSYSDSAVPVQVHGLSGMTALACGGTHTLALKNDGTVWSWGLNNRGQLGDGTTLDKNTPIQVSGLTGITAIAAGSLHSLALDASGTVWAWGHNIYGQLGDGTNTGRLSPVQITGLTGVERIASRNTHSIALKSDGSIYAWGYNFSGQLGDGTNTDKKTPVQVPGLTGITTIATGAYHSSARRNDGTIWTWGNNVDGQLGDGTNTNQNTPVQVTGF